MHSTRSPIGYVLVGVAATLLIVGCREREPETANVPGRVAEVQVTPVEPAQPRAPLDRERLIVAVLRAATAAALGRDDAAVQSELKGRRFQLRMRFGCSGADPKAQSGWAYDEGKGVLRARVRADIDVDQADRGAGLGGDYEGAIGFRLQRPWMLTDGCPNPKFQQFDGGPAITVIQRFTGSDSRVQRPESSYETVTPIAPQQLPSQGLTLVLAGRIEPLSDGRAIHCSPAGGPPACMVSALIDRVAIEEPERGVVLGEWGAS